MKQTNEFSIVT